MPNSVPTPCIKALRTVASVLVPGVYALNSTAVLIPGEPDSTLGLVSICVSPASPQAAHNLIHEQSRDSRRDNDQQRPARSLFALHPFGQAFGRGLTNAFSRKLENHGAAVALYYFACNFVKIHRTLRVTPAMAARVTDRLWGVSDLVALLEAEERRQERAA